GGGRGRAEGLPALHRGPDRLLRHRHRPGLLHLRRGPDQGHRRPGQGGRLVRQRVGLLQPPRRPGGTRRRRSLTASPTGGRWMRTIEQLADQLGGLQGRRILVRSDLNVPLDSTDGPTRITDDGRVRASVPTIQQLLAAGARVVVCAHLGRPKGAPEARYSLAPVATRLAELLGAEVALLENLRFNPGETSKDDAERGAFADELAGLADGFVSDGFGVVHRKQAS